MGIRVRDVLATCHDFSDEEHLALITALVKIFSGFDGTEVQDEGWTGS